VSCLESALLNCLESPLLRCLESVLLSCLESAPLLNCCLDISMTRADCHSQ